MAAGLGGFGVVTAATPDPVPAAGRDWAAFHFTWIPDTPVVLTLLPMIEKVLSPFEDRPHWGKLFTCDAITLRLRSSSTPYAPGARAPSATSIASSIAKWNSRSGSVAGPSWCATLPWSMT